MKKLITLIAGLLLVALPVGLAGCDDSDKEIYNDGRLVTDVVIPTSMTVYRGMEVSVSGYGFAQGDAIALRAGEDLPAATTVASEKLLTFVIPDGAADQTVYKVVLNRAQDYQGARIEQDDRTTGHRRRPGQDHLGQLGRRRRDPRPRVHGYGQTLPGTRGGEIRSAGQEC